VPAHPDEAAVRAARDLIMRELLGEFPFVDAAGRAHAAALLLLPLVREVIDGPTPLHLIDAPAPGSGKGLLAQVAAGLFAGTALAPQTVAQTSDEWRKRLTACFAWGASHLWLDNVDRKLESGELAAALTATSWTDRFLGSSRLLEAPVRTVWLATGNNVRLSEELARRTLWIRLDSGRARPCERSGFRHPDLRAWARQERPRLLAAALTLVQAWVAAGRPAGGATLGSFESWAAVMSGLLEVAGIPGLLQNATALYEQVEDDEADWPGLVERWAAVLGDRPVGVSEIYALVAGSELLADALGEGGDRARKTRLGMLLSARHGRVYGAWRIVRAGRKQNAAQYRLVRCEREGP
jgi:putative DNA primase/helicase